MVIEMVVCSSTRALWEAIESCFDGIEITTPDAEYQVERDTP